MTTISATELKVTKLADMLRAWPDGDYTDEAAVELLIGHGTWLGRRDFRARLIDAIDDGWSRNGLIPMASIDWTTVPKFLHEVPASSSEAAILRIAASIAGTDTGAIDGLIYSLDPTNTELVLQALAHAAGWHERHRHAFITGDFSHDAQCGAIRTAKGASAVHAVQQSANQAAGAAR